MIQQQSAQEDDVSMKSNSISDASDDTAWDDANLIGNIGNVNDLAFSKQMMKILLDCFCIVDSSSQK